MNSERKEKIIERIGELAILLGGTSEYRTCYSSTGLATKKIIVEYDHHQTKRKQLSTATETLNLEELNNF